MGQGRGRLNKLFFSSWAFSQLAPTILKYRHRVGAIAIAIDIAIARAAVLPLLSWPSISSVASGQCPETPEPNVTEMALCRWRCNHHQTLLASRGRSWDLRRPTGKEIACIAPSRPSTGAVVSTSRAFIAPQSLGRLVARPMGCNWVQVHNMGDVFSAPPPHLH